MPHNANMYVNIIYILVEHRNLDMFGILKKMYEI